MTSAVYIRPWKPEDAGALATLCNNRNIWINVRDRFPHPYTVAHAVEWIAWNKDRQPAENLAIMYGERLAGSIGVIIKDDIYRKSIEVGYFIGEDFWGKGIATEALALMLQHIGKYYDVIRIYAEVFETNIASMKVLKKNGFHLEGIRQKAVIKNNVVMDDYVWVKLMDR